MKKISDFIGQETFQKIIDVARANYEKSIERFLTEEKSSGFALIDVIDSLNRWIGYSENEEIFEENLKIKNQENEKHELYKKDVQSSINEKRRIQQNQKRYAFRHYFSQLIIAAPEESFSSCAEKSLEMIEIEEEYFGKIDQD